MLIYVKIIIKKMFFIRQTHVQLKTIVRNLTKKGLKKKKNKPYIVTHC